MPQISEDLQRLIDRLARRRHARSREGIRRGARTRRPELYDELLGARNRKWLPKIEALLDDDRDYLVVVGALHFVGRDGLLDC